MARAAVKEDRDGLDGESFGRLPSLTHQIRELIHDYPEGVGIIKELVQNADDAGARTLRLVVTAMAMATHFREPRLFPGLWHWQQMRGI